LYTDGLIESRRGAIDKGMEALRTAVEGHHGDLASLLDDRVLRPPRPESSGDDVALLMVRLLPVPTGNLSLPGTVDPAGSEISYADGELSASDLVAE
jgi:hypothetical protein